ncbi:MAG: transporter substrate-binding domain-containing protein [Jannaschia helgolandensis]|jgi:polar amino acid transport system substrate-binding protein|uniref:Amino acid ABC transporter substrate-binding protein, PAAT family n=1 Tax=Jannaschia helgolandensis TaxID=188906 RepID=A0A1H7LFD6_9RHOB|nr:transporter substrate-binding domain-containing protein [Jannaschia helgolandensis]SEK97674.1 amino acid ABC transporter substrate-binding protein, PAAT family [Jannaschia helgolandensis]
MELKALAHDGVLRTAINTGNRALVQGDANTLAGISPALARRLADEIGATMMPVVYPGAGRVFADAQQDKWDVGFLAIDPQRARAIAFTRPYLTIEATYAVRADSDFHDVDDVDRSGVQVLTSAGSAYDMHLTSSLQHARLQRSGTPPESFAAFRDGQCDAVAGVRASLVEDFENDPAIRILPGVLTSVRQAMVLPDPQAPLIAALDDFVARAIGDGFVASIMAETGHD